MTAVVEAKCQLTGSIVILAPFTSQGSPSLPLATPRAPDASEAGSRA